MEYFVCNLGRLFYSNASFCGGGGDGSTRVQIARMCYSRSYYSDTLGGRLTIGFLLAVLD